MINEETFPAFSYQQIDKDFRDWNTALDGKIAGIRFGQFFCNRHKLHHSLFYLPDSKEALAYIKSFGF